MTTELLLGMIGTATGTGALLIGIISLYLHWKKSKKDKPILDLVIHKTEIIPKTKKLSVQFELHNRGDIDTTISRFELFLNGKVKPKVSLFEANIYEAGGDISPTSYIALPFGVNSHDTNMMVALVDLSAAGVSKVENIKIELKHTHGSAETEKDVNKKQQKTKRKDK